MSPVPSVGRDVHYVSYGTPGGEYKSECRAAKITAVKNPEEVSLCVFNPEGLFFHKDPLPRDDGGSDGYAGGTWHWPERTPE